MGGAGKPTACHGETPDSRVKQSPLYTRLLVQIEALTVVQFAFTRVVDNNDEVSESSDLASDRPSPRLLRQRLLCAALIIGDFRPIANSDRMFKRDLLEAYLDTARAIGQYQAVFEKHESKDMNGSHPWDSGDRATSRDASALQTIAEGHLRAIAERSILPLTIGKRSGLAVAEHPALTCQEASILRDRLSLPLKGELSAYSITARMFSDSLILSGCNP